MRITRILKPLSETTLYVPTKGAYTNKVYLVGVFVFLEVDMGQRTWIKIYCNKWLHGTLREETPQLRGTWIDLLTLAGNGNFGDSGEIKLSSNIGLYDEQIASILRIPLTLWQQIKQRLLETEHISITQQNIIKICNWEKYQSEYQRQKEYREDKKLQLEVTIESYKSKCGEKEKEKEKEKENKDKNILCPVSQDVVAYLNLKAGTSYKATTRKTQDLIKTRQKEGFTLEDFKTVIDKKVVYWKNDIKMSKFLRPETLFGNKFEGYLNEPTKPKAWDE